MVIVPGLFSSGPAQRKAVKFSGTVLETVLEILSSLQLQVLTLLS